MKTVSLPERISKIHSYCFYGTTSLLTIKIPDSVESIQSYAFYKSGLQTILITGNSKLKEISFDCFSYTKISSFYIPKSLTKLDISNLINCPLNEIRVHPNNMKYRGDVNNKFLASGNTLIRVVESCSEDYIVDDLITSIAQYCFYNTRISSVKLNDKIQYIGNNAFKNCYSLTNIIIPGSVIEIGFNAFFGCNHLKAIKFLSNSNKIIIGFSLFDGISNPINIYIPGKFDLNSSINKSFPIGSHLYITSHTTLSDSSKTFFGNQSMIVHFNNQSIIADTTTNAVIHYISIYIIQKTEPFPFFIYSGKRKIYKK